MIGVAALLMVIVTLHSSTPQAAARRVVYSSHGSKVVIVRTNIVGPYATVLIHGGYMEGSPAGDAALLFKHFSFGWQGLESLEFRCRLDSQVTSPTERPELMRGMPAPIDRSACGSRNLVDFGSPAGIDAIRRSRDEAFVPAVIVSGNFALVGWYGGGGGEDLLQKRGNRWHVVADGGGLLDVSQLRERGVPKASWRLFGIDEAKSALGRSSLCREGEPVHTRGSNKASFAFGLSLARTTATRGADLSSTSIRVRCARRLPTEHLRMTRAVFPRLRSAIGRGFEAVRRCERVARRLRSRLWRDCTRWGRSTVRLSAAVP
jgi:hypothetical protein